MTTLSTPRGRSSLAVSIVFTCLATVLVLIRVYTRAFMVKQMGSDDYTILIALVRDHRQNVHTRSLAKLAQGILMDLLRHICRW